MNERKVEHLLALANGNRRARILTLSDVSLLLSRLERRPGSFLADSGGAVPGIYNYRALTTIALAIRRRDGKIALAIGVTGAQPGYSPRPHWLASEIPVVAAQHRLQMLDWADNAVERVETDGGLLVLWQKNRARIFTEYLS